MPEEKECGHCHRTLAASCFSRERANFDGLQSMCKECKRTYSGNRKESLFHVAVPSKRCCECTTDKPAAAFSARPNSTDGLVQRAGSAPADLNSSGSSGGSSRRISSSSSSSCPAQYDSYQRRDAPAAGPTHPGAATVINQAVHIHGPGTRFCTPAEHNTQLSIGWHPSCRLLRTSWDCGLRWVTVRTCRVSKPFCT